LKRNDDEEADIVAWASTAVQMTHSWKQRAAAQREKVNEKELEIKRLQEQLDEFIKASHERDRDLLLKFAVLLNAKKAKIRDQQRTIAELQGERIYPMAVLLLAALTYIYHVPYYQEASLQRLI